MIKRIVIRTLIVISALLTCLLLTLRLTAGDVPLPSGEKLARLAVVNVNVIDVRAGVVVEKQTVLIEDGVIRAVGNSDAVTVPAGFDVLDKSGQFAVPGFWDMHVHFNRIQQHYAGPMFVMNGVFYVRNMSGDCAGGRCAFDRSIRENRSLQRLVENDELLAPNFFGIGSYIIRGPRAGYGGDARYPRDPRFLVPRTEEEGRALARYFRERGVDFLKSYNSLPRDAFMGLAAEAGRSEFYVGGHVPRSMTLNEALAAGMRTIEHGRMLPLACSAHAESFAAEYGAWLSSNDEEAQAPRLDSLYEDIVSSFDETACDAVLQSWAALDSYYVPTHLTRLAEATVADRPFASDVRANHIPELVLRTSWEGEAAKYGELFAENPEARDHYRRFYEWGVTLTGRAHRAGVKLLLGTDAGDTLIYPGSSFHDEMQIYSTAGIEAADILAAATVSAAEFNGLSETHGRLEAGLTGDIVFLTANPLQDIANTRAIGSLYFNGHYYDSASRNAVMAEVERKARGSGQFLTTGWFLLTRFLPFYVRYELFDDEQ